MSDRPTIVTTDVSLAADALRKGRLVAFGTETVYGLGGDATRPDVVASIFEAKGRPRFDPLIVHLAAAEDVSGVAAGWPDEAANLAAVFWPGPLTIVTPKTDRVPDLVTSGLPDVAVRVPGSAVARELIRQSGVPVAAPSANRFGAVSPTTAAHVLDQLAGRVDVILDTGPATVGVESTVVRFDRGRCVLLRPGGVPLESIGAVAGAVDVAADSQRGEAITQGSPGRLPSHYSPGVPVRPSNSSGRAAPPGGPDVGLLAFGRRAEDWPGPRFVLSESGDLAEAASRLFSGLRRLAADGAALIVVDPIPDTGLGRAINDRLRRASSAEP